MGLELCVGIFAPALDLFNDDPDLMDNQRSVFAGINAVLQAAGLQEYEEREGIEENLDGVEMPWQTGMGRYANIHFVRRFYAHVLERRSQSPFAIVMLPPTWPGDRASEDPLLLRAYDSDFDSTSPFNGSHLIQHADSTGYYVPVDFPKALCPHQYPGHDLWQQTENSNLGSSYGLRRECEDVAALLELDISRPDLTADADTGFSNLEARLRLQPTTEQPIWLRQGYTIEARACWALFHGSLASIQTKLALCFI